MKTRRSQRWFAKDGLRAPWVFHGPSSWFVLWGLASYRVLLSHDELDLVNTGAGTLSVSRPGGTGYSMRA